jgi:hypothetical protein
MAKKAKKAKKAKWTVMLYMAASKDEQTEQAAIRDIKELEKVTATKDLNVLVQIDRRWPGYAERYVVENGISTQREPKYGEKNINSGKPEVLRDFVAWGRTMFPADYFLLVLWGHSFGLGFGRDHGDALTLPEIAASLDRQALKDSGVPIAPYRKAVDILGANACAMSYAECAYELQDAADFLLAPEIAMPFQGWPYDSILTDIVDNPAITPKELGAKIIDRFMTSFAEAIEPRSVSLTLLNLQGAKDIRARLKEFATALAAALDPARNRDKLREQIADAFLDTAHGDVRPLIDLFDLCERLTALDTVDLDDDDRETAATVIDAANEFRGFLKPGGQFVVQHRAVSELDGIHGVGIFAPAVSGASELIRFDSSRREYKKLRLVKDTGWASVAYTRLKELLDPINRAVADFVNATATTGREDRLGLAQLLVSVHRSFTRLEKAVAESRRDVMEIVDGNGAAKGLVPGPLPFNVRFGPPFLRLAASIGELSPSRRDALRTLPDVGIMNEIAEDSELLRTVPPLAKLEDALSNAERTVKRVMTHSRLGLGELKPDLGELKPDLGELKPDLGELKPDLGELKPDLGELKPDLGLFSSPASAETGYATSDGTRRVTDVYRQVAWSLQLLESGVAKIENDIRGALPASTNGATNSEFSRRTMEQLQQSFRSLHELVSNAKATAGSVLSHSEYGLGPTPQRTLRAPGRQHLAIAGGLSSRFLRLL